MTRLLLSAMMMAFLSFGPVLAHHRGGGHHSGRCQGCSAVQACKDCKGCENCKDCNHQGSSCQDCKGNCKGCGNQSRQGPNAKPAPDAKAPR
jgi:hypothetical protein